MTVSSLELGSRVRVQRIIWPKTNRKHCCWSRSVAWHIIWSLSSGVTVHPKMKQMCHMYSISFHLQLNKCNFQQYICHALLYIMKVNVLFKLTIWNNYSRSLQQYHLDQYSLSIPSILLFSPFFPVCSAPLQRELSWPDQDHTESLWGRFLHKDDAWKLWALGPAWEGGRCSALQVRERIMTFSSSL